KALKLGFGATQAEAFLQENELNTDQFLSGLIFEILAYQARERHPGETFRYRRAWGDREPSRAFRFSGFFRPFYADIISNTICADLIDYLIRDAVNTGIRRSIDLKFLDRMFVKPIPQRQDERRVVFDLRDSRRGIRKDTVSALLNLLESRYDLMERVYMHRTKLAASVMLGRAYYLAGIRPEQLYNTVS